MIKQETCTVKHVARPPAGACRGNVQPPAAALALGNVQPPAAALARTHAGIRYGRRLAALTRDKVPPQAGRTCEQSMRRPAALARTHAGIRYGRRLAALARPHAGAMYSRRPAALTLPHGGRPEAGIRCGRSSYPASIVCLRAKHGSRPKYAFGERIHARKAWFETKVCIRRENSCTQDMPHASIPARGARGSDGGGRGAKKEN